MCFCTHLWKQRINRRAATPTTQVNTSTNMEQIISKAFSGKPLTGLVVNRYITHYADSGSEYGNPISVVIRTRNEEEHIGQVLEALRAQKSVGVMQIIIVDNESTDETVAIAKKYNCEVYAILKQDFSYPKALNLGMSYAKHETVAVLSGHSIPTHQHWMAQGAHGLTRKGIAGVYGPTLPNNNASLLERMVRLPKLMLLRKPVVEDISSSVTGVFGATNCILKRSYWQKHKFDEGFGAGGEDTMWARQQLELGRKITKCLGFAVLHAHKISSIGYIRQFIHWIRVGGGKKLQFSEDAWIKHRWRS